MYVVEIESPGGTLDLTTSKTIGEGITRMQAMAKRKQQKSGLMFGGGFQVRVYENGNKVAHQVSHVNDESYRLEFTDWVLK